MERLGPSELPAHLRAFLYSCIDSIEQLEMLVLLQEAGGFWSVRAVAERFGAPQARCRASLEALVARGLLQAAVRAEVTYTFRPVSEPLAGYCDELAAWLDTSRATVLRFVAALPPPSVRRFANAFKLRDQE